MSFVSDLKEDIQHRLPGASNAKGSTVSLHGITDWEKAFLLTEGVKIEFYR